VPDLKSQERSSGFQFIQEQLLSSATLQRFDYPTLCVIVLRFPSDERKVMVFILMCIHESSTASLLDRVCIVAQVRQPPPLRVIVLRFPSDERKVMVFILMCIHESATAPLLDRVYISAQVCQQPPLCVIVLRFPSDERKVLIRILMGIHESATTLLLDCMRTLELGGWLRGHGSLDPEPLSKRLGQFLRDNVVPSAIWMHGAFCIALDKH